MQIPNKPVPIAEVPDLEKWRELLGNFDKMVELHKKQLELYGQLKVAYNHELLKKYRWTGRVAGGSARGVEYTADEVQVVEHACEHSPAGLCVVPRVHIACGPYIGMKRGTCCCCDQTLVETPRGWMTEQKLREIKKGKG